MSLASSTLSLNARRGPLLAVAVAGTMGVGALLVSIAGGEPAVAASRPALRFDEASVQLVANRTDHDGQLFWSVTYEKRMADVAIHAPSGALVATATFDRTGQADAHFDSPEPTVTTLKKTYPPGRYVVTGHTTSGRRLASVITLTYKHVGTPTIISPKPDQDVVATTGLVVRWSAVPGASTIHIQVESDEPARALEIDLSGAATKFRVPDGFLKAGVEYVVDVLAQHPSGNYTMRDVTFATQP